MVKSSRVALFCFVVVAVFNGVCPGSRSGSLEYWQTTGFSLDISEDLGFHAEQEFRAGRSGAEPYLHSANLGIVYKSLADWVDIGLDFKKEYEEDSEGKFRQENRPHLNITLKGGLFDLDASNRARLEYRNRQKKEDLFRFRNKTTVKFPFKFTKLSLQPYLSEEFFIDVGENNTNQNRLSSGFSCPLGKNLKASVYYMWKTSKITGGWEDTNVIGAQFKFLF